MRGEMTPSILRQFFRGYTRHQIAYDLGCSVYRVHSILKRRHLKTKHDIIIHRGAKRHYDVSQSAWDFQTVLDAGFDELR